MKPAIHRTNRLLRYILLVLCIGLVILLSLKMLVSSQPPSYSVITPEQVPEQVDAGTIENQAPQAEISPKALSAYDAIIQRPLFSQTRRPFVPPTIQEPSPIEAPPPRVEEPMPITLIAVIMHAHKRIAILRNDTNQKLSRLLEDESIDGWQLKELTPDSAQLVKGAEIMDLKLHVSRSKPVNIPPQTSNLAPQSKQPEATEQAANKNKQKTMSAVQSTEQTIIKWVASDFLLRVMPTL